MKFGVMRVMGKKLKDTELMSHVAIWTFYLEKQKKRQNGHTSFLKLAKDEIHVFWGFKKPKNIFFTCLWGVSECFVRNKYSYTGVKM